MRRKVNDASGTCVVDQEGTYPKTRKRRNTRRKPRSRFRNRPPLTEEQKRLAERYLPMARSLAKALKANFPQERDEFESAACMALVEAAQAYNPSRNVAFGTYAFHRIKGELRDVQRDLRLHGWEDDLENAPERVTLHPYHEEMGRVLFCRPDRPVPDMIDELDDWLRKLPRQYSSALRQIYVHGLTLERTARVLGRSKSRVSTIHSESIALLNQSLNWNRQPRTRSIPPDEAFPCSEDLNPAARFGEAEAPGEPQSDPVRAEPRSPQITNGHPGGGSDPCSS